MSFFLTALAWGATLCLLGLAGACIWRWIEDWSIRRALRRHWTWLR